MPCCVVRGEDSVRLLVLPRDQRVAGREVRFLTNTMEIEHSFQSIDAGLVYHFSNSRSRVRSSLPPRLSNTIGIRRPR